MGAYSQRKGADGERELAAKLKEYGFKVERGGSLTFGLTPDITGLPGIHVEVKRVERLNVPEAMRQAIRDAEAFLDGIPVLFHRRNRQPWLVTLRLDDFMSIYQVWRKEKYEKGEYNHVYVRTGNKNQSNSVRSNHEDV